MGFLFIALFLPFVALCVVSYFLARYAFRKLVVAENKHAFPWSIASFIVALAALSVLYLILLFGFIAPFER